MATLVAEAIEIITDAGLGIPVTYTNTGIGLASDGHFYLITDRFDLSGAKIITGDTTRTIWYEKILSRNYGAFAISRTADFVDAGGIEAVSSFSFTIKNTALFWNTLATNGVYLSRRKVKYYRVTSTDGVTFNFELRWTGIVDDQPFNELTQSINCVDTSKEIFKTLPPNAINSAAFPLAPSESLDKSIPISIGRVAYSPLIQLKTPGKKVNVNLIDNIYYTPSAVFDYVVGTPWGSIISLYMTGVEFVKDDPRLVGKFVSMISGASPQYTKIIFNNPSGDQTAGGKKIKVVDITLLDVISSTWTPSGPNRTNWVSSGTGSTSNMVWYAEVVDISNTDIVSNKSVYQYITGENKRNRISSFSSSLKAYSDVSQISSESSLSNIDYSNLPGYIISGVSFDDSISMNTFSPQVARDIKYISGTGFSTSDLPSAGASANKLVDVSLALGHYYTLTKTANATSTGTLVFDLYFPKEISKKNYKNLYLLLDFGYSVNTVACAGSFEIDVLLIDIYGRSSTTILSAVDLGITILPTASTDFLMLPGSYYNIKRLETDFNNIRAKLDLALLLTDSNKTITYNYIRVTFRLIMFPIGTQTATLKLYEMGLTGNHAINISSDPLFGTLIGETFGSGWQSRKTSTNAIYLPTDALEHLIRDYDTSASFWLVAHAYVVGDKVKSVSDNGHIFVCSVAGTSHATTEPTWVTTSGATTTDNTVTWKEFQTIPIDTTTFDSASSQRTSWLIGRTLVDKKPSVDYYKEILQQCFLIMLTDSTGKAKIKAWRDNTTALATFDGLNILQGSLGKMALTPMRRAYNDILIRYDWSPGAGKFNKQISVTNADKPAFPSSTEYSSVGVSLGTFSATRQPLGGGVTLLTITTTVAHGLSSGDYVALSGNVDGYDFDLRKVGVTSTTVFSVFISGYLAVSPSTTGTLSNFPSNGLKWKTYVTGVDNYANGIYLWNQCHNSYLITKTINKLPQELSDCYWFIDPGAKDPGGTLIWPDLAVGDEHAAYFYATNIVNWSAWQKKQITFEVIDSATNSLREIGDPVNFNDAKLTNGAALLGWIHEKTQLPRTDVLPERFRFGVTLNPEQLVDTLIIDENGATDIIDENGATNIYDENG